MQNYQQELSDIEKTRLKNIELHKEEFKKLFPDGLIKPLSSNRKITGPRQKRRSYQGKKFVQNEPRKSLRIAIKRSLDLPEDHSETEISANEPNGCTNSGIWFGNWTKLQRKQAAKHGDEYEGEMPSPKRRKTRCYEVPTSPGKIEDIAESCSEKIYNADYGTSCHQCRQKTLDTKTVCRSGRCIGIRGQFCGPCLRNRYGESVKEAILNEEWCCPPCREICNCSFCMKKRGRRATGILIHLAKENGYSDVKTFLGD